MVKKLNYIIPKENEVLIMRDDIVKKRVNANGFIIELCELKGKEFYRVWEKVDNDTWNILGVTYGLKGVEMILLQVTRDEDYTKHLFNVIQLKLIAQ